MTVYKKMRCFVDTREIEGGIPDRDSGEWLEIPFEDEDTGDTFTPESIIIKLDIAQTYLEYSFSEGDEKTVHGRIYNIGNSAPPNGAGQETVSEGNALATSMFIRADDANAIARIWARIN